MSKEPREKHPVAKVVFSTVADVACVAVLVGFSAKAFLKLKHFIER